MAINFGALLRYARGGAGARVVPQGRDGGTRMSRTSARTRRRCSSSSRGADCQSRTAGSHDQLKREELRSMTQPSLSVERMRAEAANW